MPKKINDSMLAPCGMNCIVCCKHCNSKEPCYGCFSNGNAKSEHCQKCKIRTCVIERGFTYCFECSDFPCKLNKSLEKRYERYGWSLIMNGQDAKDKGVATFLESDCSYWTCSRCGGVISLHDSSCSGCHTRLADMKLKPYAQFGIIDDFDEQKDYSVFTEGLRFKDCLKKYHCIEIPDDIINDWWDGLTSMKSYYHKYSRPETALARWGVTLIPPDSLDLFIEIINTRTNKRFLVLCKIELTALLELLRRAKNKNKFVIHYGV